MKRNVYLIYFIPVFLLSFFFCSASFGWVKGIYITQATCENTNTLKHLIDKSKQVGINTFVIDYGYHNTRYKQNIKLVHEANLRYVARIVMFPGGATPEQMKSQSYLEGRYRYIREAIAMGAHDIQLDYIRYKPTRRASSQNAQDVFQVIHSVREMLKGTGVGLQIDVFGEVAEHDSPYIGQNATLFANGVDVICPMVYPSHFEPYIYHATRPYQTVYTALTTIRGLIHKNPDVRVIGYIELFNYRYPMNVNQRTQYILAELKAIRDSHADGWYFWSANNRYSHLFEILSSSHVLED